MLNEMKKVLALVGLAVLLSVPFLGLLPSQNALAAESDVISIKPAKPDLNVKFSDFWFIYTFNKGETKNDSVLIINKKQKPTTVVIEALDAVSTSDGSFGLVRAEDENRDLGGWIKLSQKELDLGPNSTQEVPFTLSVPNDADVGDHLGGIAVREKIKNEAGGISLITRVGVRMYLTVPGLIKRELALKKMDHYIVQEQIEKKVEGSDIPERVSEARLYFTLEIENKGNVHIEPTGTITVRNLFFKPQTFEWTFGDAFPGKTFTARIRWDRKAPIFGRFVAKATIPYDKEDPSKVTTIQHVFWLIPTQELMYVGLLIILLIIIRLIRQTFAKIARRRMVRYVVKSGDTLVSVADEFGVSWRKTVKINRLKKPYHLRPGQRIILPLVRPKSMPRQRIDNF